MQSVHDISNSTVPTQYLKRTPSSAFRANQRPQCSQAHTLISNTRGARAKSTFSHLKSVYIKHEVQPTSPEPEAAKRQPIEKKSGTKGSSKYEPKSKGNESINHADMVKPPASRELKSKLMPRQLRPQAAHEQREGTKARKHTKKTKAEKEQAMAQKKAHRQPKGAKQKEKESYDERRKAFRGNDTESLALQNQSQRIAVRRVSSSQSIAPGARDVNLSTEDIAEQVRLSGKSLARLTEHIRLLTELKGSTLEGLQRWGTKTKMKRLAPTPASSGTRRRRLVRIVKSQTPPLSSTLPRDFPSLVTHLHRSLTVVRQRTRLLRAQLSSYLPHTHLPPHPQATRLAAAAQHYEFYRPVKKTQLRHSIDIIHQRTQRIFKSVRLLSAQISALTPRTPIVLRKHSARIAPRSRLSRRPEQLVTSSASTKQRPAKQTNPRRPARRRTAPLLSLPKHKFRAAIRPLSEKLRYGDGLTFAAARWKNLRPRVSYKGFRNQRDAVRFLEVKRGARARRVKVKSRHEKNLASAVADWLGEGSVRGGGLW